MKLADYAFDLPPERIAQYPAAERTDARLLILDGATGALDDRSIKDIVAFVKAGDLMVFNDTRVIRARLFGRKESGGRVEIMLERITGDSSAIAQVRASKPPRPGTRLVVEESYEFEVVARTADNLFELRSLSADSIAAVASRIGHVPLPPYIARADEPADRERYQTVFARVPGAVAAPTAALHFDHDLIAALRGRGCDIGYLTLHVGAGTFQPVRAQDVEEHRMHNEYLQVGVGLCEQVAAARACGGRVIAVGTTCVRALESAACGESKLEPISGDTDIFIYPGYGFRVVDLLLTNFHLPESTLLLLVSAFAGRENVLRAYRHAIENGYRFYSYGDAMWVTPRKKLRATSHKLQAR